MNLATARALVTGASGGIGAAIVRQIVARGGSALITGRDEQALQALAREVDPDGESVDVHRADIVVPDDRRRLAARARSWLGGVNVLINNAGVAAAGMFADAKPEEVDGAFDVNVVAAMHLCQALLPQLQRQPRAHIVNIGSVLGSIGYPGQAIYCATKFALRGFTEALRRELSDGSVQVHYVAPRATRTRFNSSSVDALNARLKVSVDSPQRVAAQVCRMLEREQATATLGWPEKLFVRINDVAPWLVDRSLAGQLPVIRETLLRKTR
jgi:short-subunit dehydrogenase